MNEGSIYTPRFLVAIEERISRALPAHPKTLSAIKLVVVAMMYLSLTRIVEDERLRHWAAFALFVAFVTLDYLSTLAARAAGKEKSFGRIFDRVTDLPLTLMLCYMSLGVLPVALLALKLAVDILLIVLYLRSVGTPQNRFRTGVNYSTYLAMLLLLQGMAGKFIGVEQVSYLLVANIVFFCLTALYNLNVIQKRFIADALSGANLMCGVFSMIFSSKGRPELSLMFLMLGAAFDGFDGAAARKWGGTSWGVYSDDVADAVNYGIAPGFALYKSIPGVDGMILGPFFTIFVLSRLVFFTLNKSSSDPNYFSGVPSTLGGLVTLCSIILFEGHPTILGLMVGVACAQMVSFDTSYRHLGRALSGNREAFYGMPILLVALIGSGKHYGIEVPVAAVLAACLFYGFRPTAARLWSVIRKPTPA